MSKTEQIQIHSLTGCRPTPLAHYLKALGILRLVSEQADPSARGWWKNDVFHLATTLRRHELETFFNNKYAPTPMTAAWLPRSGYSKGSNHKKTRQFLEPLIESTCSRFESFRMVASLMEDISHTDGFSIDDPASLRNMACILKARANGPRAFQEWCDTSIVFATEKQSYPAILGTGGSEGSGSYMANFYVALNATIIEKLEGVENSLWQHTSPSLNSPLSLYLNRSNFNAGHFDSQIKQQCPWTYILAVEGTLLFKANATRRLSPELSSPVSGTNASMAAPFAVGNSCVGYGSSSQRDSKTKQSGSLAGGRGEQWFPIWNQPATLDELKAFFAKGRMTVGRERAKYATDAARAISRAGIEKGVEAFERYGYLQRNGDNHIAVPLGRFAVRSPKNQNLLDEAAPWIDRLRRITTDKNAPTSLLRAFRKCEDAIFRCVRNPIGNSFLHLLIAMAEAEDQLISSPKFAAEKNAWPIPWLTGPWMEEIEQSEQSHEFRLARSLARQTTPYSKGTQQTPIREHWVPLSGSYFAKGESGLTNGPQQCATGMDLSRATIEVMKRRLLMMHNSQLANVPLVLDREADACSLADIKAFVERRVDQKKILSTARALMALQFRSTHDKNSGSQPESNSLAGLATYGLCRLAFSNRPIFVPQQDDVDVKVSPTVFVRLANGDSPRAADLAIRLLSNAGLRPKVQLAVTSPTVSKRIAASMIFGLSRSSMTRIAMELTAPQMDPSTEQEMKESYFDPV
ncbi:type I-G CRISPR-associated protein Cas8g1/Csx17 [Rhodopirellula bahusiensis]|nr:type I-U CRISPR-associated protein Csx17 [Rhodopirellula bahusiensis]